MADIALVSDFQAVRARDVRGRRPHLRQRANLVALESCLQWQVVAIVRFSDATIVGRPAEHCSMIEISASYACHHSRGAVLAYRERSVPTRLRGGGGS